MRSTFTIVFMVVLSFGITGCLEAPSEQGGPPGEMAGEPLPLPGPPPREPPQDGGPESPPGDQSLKGYLCSSLQTGVGGIAAGCLELSCFEAYCDPSPLASGRSLATVLQCVSQMGNFPVPSNPFATAAQCGLSVGKAAAEWLDRFIQDQEDVPCEGQPNSVYQMSCCRSECNGDLMSQCFDQCSRS